MSSYDEIPYTQNIYPQTQPDTLATIAILRDHTPPAVAHCRVLELGCAQGDNLIAMAQALPQGFFVGIDSAATQIAAGNQTVAQLNLINIQLKCRDLQAITAEFGKFDYIIAHGVYSWVAPAVREKLFAICHDHLQPQGIAYISYNTYPGWQSDAMLRDILLFHLRNIHAPAERLKVAKQLLKSFAHSIVSRYDNHALSLKNKLHHLLQVSDNYFAHEHLEEYNHAVFFHQFIEQVTQHHLHYLVDLQTYADNPLPEIIHEDFVTQQQDHDFLVNRRYRETLLCHQKISAPSQLNYLKIKELYLSAALQCHATEPQILTADEVRFENFAGKVVAIVSLPVLKIAGYHLSRVYPKILSFKEFINALLTDYSFEINAEDETELLQFLCNLFLTKDVELYSYPPHFALSVSSCPLASPLARLQSQRTEVVTNLRYETFVLDKTTCLLLSLLDGKRDHQQILFQLNKQLADKSYNLSQLQQRLETLARKAFLID
jgi:methyltransferase-like protein/2-polyprenyl-3-methyl-5-hydroxy-6-metoxy-1,4-benzoquinol methylase